MPTNIVKPLQWYDYNRDDPRGTGLADLRPFWRGMGGEAQELVNDNHGTLNSGATWITSDRGPAVDVDGTDGLVAASSVISTTDPRPCTIGIWVKVDDTNKVRHSIFTNNGSSNGPAWYVELEQVAGTTYRQRLYSQAYDSSADTFTLDTLWHHYLWTWADDDVVGYFRDGEPMGTGTKTLAGIPGSGLNIGGIDALTGGGFTLDGQFDGSAVWSRVLTQEEIKDDFNRPYDLITPGTQTIAVEVAAGGPPRGSLALFGVGA